MAGVGPGEGARAGEPAREEPADEPATKVAPPDTEPTTGAGAADGEPATAVRPDAAAAADPDAAPASEPEPPTEEAARPARRPPPEPAPAPPTATFQALILIAAAALSGFTILRGYGPHDEGLMLAWADRIAGGQWPYRDFWSNYAPGQPLVLAGLVKLFGPSLLAWRVLRVAVDALTALAAYRLVRRDAGERWALAAWLAVAGAMAFPAGPGPTPPALLLALAALLSARRAPGRGGALAGLAFVFRPEVGIAAALGVALERRSPRPLVPAALVAAGALAPFAIVAKGAMADQLLGFASMQSLQRLPLVPALHVGADPNKLLELLFPLLLVLATLVWVAWAAWRRPAPSTLALAPLIGIGLAYLLARADEFHLLPLSAALAIALALAAGRERATAAKAVLAIALAVIAVHGLDRRAGELRHPPHLEAIPGAVAGGVRTTPADARALRRVLRAVRRRARPGQPVLVAPPRFDRVRVGDPLLNVLLRRPNPTRYDVMQPGIVTTAKVQREMARDLVRSRAPVVVRWLAPTARLREPNGSARSSGVHLLDRTIARRYRRLVRYGDYVILVRRSRPSGP
jgi:hypothetical protein